MPHDIDPGADRAAPQTVRGLRALLALALACALYMSIVYAISLPGA